MNTNTQIVINDKNKEQQIKNTCCDTKYSCKYCSYRYKGTNFVDNKNEFYQQNYKNNNLSW